MTLNVSEIPYTNDFQFNFSTRDESAAQDFEDWCDERGIHCTPFSFESTYPPSWHSIFSGKLNQRQAVLMKLLWGVADNK